jgi:hypothetical protein
VELTCPLPLQYEQIVMAHGGGGRLMQQLLARVVQPTFSNDYLNQQHDSAVFSAIGCADDRRRIIRVNSNERVRTSAHPMIISAPYRVEPSGAR